MKINPRYFPAIILTVFALFVVLGLLLGFRPQHGGSGNHRSGAGWIRPVPILVEAIL